jgi:hypothetical protein
MTLAEFEQIPSPEIGKMELVNGKVITTRYTITTSSANALCVSLTEKRAAATAHGRTTPAIALPVAGTGAGRQHFVVCSSNGTRSISSARP